MILPFSLLLWLQLMCTLAPASLSSSGNPTAVTDQLVLVELFTSEGCSSCPSADALVAKVAASDPRVVALSFHVDYWDYLGWKDPFSQAAFTQRQQAYGRQLRLNSIYTPQVVVNGKAEFVGSNAGALQSALANAKTAQPTSKITLTKSVDAAGQITATWQVAGTTASDLYVALVQKTASITVPRGENGGRTLQHVNIVRHLSKLPATGATTHRFALPKGLTNSDVRIVAFLQNPKTLHIEAVAQTN